MNRTWWVWIFRDLGLKSLALILALLSWLLVLQEGVVERSLRTSVQIQGLQGNMMLVANAPPEVTVTLRGSANILKDLTASTLGVKLDLSGQSIPNRKYIEIVPAMIDLPQGVEVVNIRPRTLDLQFDVRIEKKFPIRVLLSGTPADGYQTGDPVLSANSVTIAGPKMLLNSYTEMTVGPIDLDQAKAAVRNTSVVNLPEGIQKNLSVVAVLEPEVISVLVPVEEVLVRKTIGRVGLELLPKGVEARLRPRTFIVVIEGPLRVVEKMGKTDLVAILDLSESVQGQKKRFIPVIKVLDPELAAEVKVVSFTQPWTEGVVIKMPEPVASDQPLEERDP